MAKAIVFVSCLAIVGLAVGIVFPRKSLFWYQGKRSRFNVLLIYTLWLVVSFILFVLTDLMQ